MELSAKMLETVACAIGKHCTDKEIADLNAKFLYEILRRKGATVETLTGCYTDRSPDRVNDETSITVDYRFTRKEYSLLHAATEANCRKVVRVLVHTGVNRVHQRDVRGRTPFMYAISHDRYEAARELLVAGSNVDDRHPSSGYTSLHTACKEGVLPRVEALLRMKADTALKTTVVVGVGDSDSEGEGEREREGEDALALALSKGHGQVSLALVEHGAAMSVVHHDLAFAVADESFFRGIAEIGIDLRPAIIVAAQIGCVPQLDMLLRVAAENYLPCDLTLLHDQDKTLLHIAVMARSTDCVNYLLNNGHKVGSESGTLLCEAAQQLDADTMEALLRNGGADPSAKNGSNRSPGSILVLHHGEPPVRMWSLLGDTENHRRWWRRGAWVMLVGKLSSSDERSDKVARSDSNEEGTEEELRKSMSFLAASPDIMKRVMKFV